jgi:Streptomycin adenylyltransferase
VDAPADPASDVDVTLFVDEPASYLDDTAWIDHFGEPLLSFREPTAVGGFEQQRVLYRDGLEVDFAIVPELARWRSEETDTWHGLRFFERWAGDDLVEALGPTFARYEAEDVARALRAKAELFGGVEDEVAARYDLVVPEDRAEVLRRLEGLLAR